MRVLGVQAGQAAEQLVERVLHEASQLPWTAAQLLRSEAVQLGNFAC